jgi:Ca2+-binding RTX toxin-like protein
MATLVLYTPYDFSINHGTFGTASVATATTITVGRSSTGEQETFTGNFTYDSSGIPHGTAMSATLSLNGRPEYTINGMTADANVLSVQLALFGDTFTVYSTMLAGDDSIMGSSGNDVLCGFGGNDVINGGGGTDTVVMSGNRSDYSVSYDSLSNTFTLGDHVSNRDGIDQISNVANFRFADGTVTAAALRPVSTTTPAIVSFSPGDGSYGAPLSGDIVITFNEVITNGPGSVVLTDLTGRVISDSTFFAGKTVDIRPDSPLTPAMGYVVTISPTAVHDQAGNYFAGNTEYHFFTAGSGGIQTGNATNPSLTGTSGDDTLIAGPGNATLDGGAGNDVLVGGVGHDLMLGGPGDDILIAGTGADTMQGGDGSDTYYVNDPGDLVIETAANTEQTDPQHPSDVGHSVDKVIASISYTLTAFVENLTLAGAAGALSGTGNELNNVITGNESNNILKGGAGNDTIDGGAGTDTAQYGGKLSDYKLTLGATTAATTVVADQRTTTSNDGTDNLANVERLQFSDVNLALDLAPSQPAGKALLTMAATLGASFPTLKDWAGIFLKYFDSGANIVDGTSLLVSTGIMAAFAGGTDNTSFVKFVYNNVNGSAPDAATLTSLVGALDNHTTTQAQWMADMAASLTNQQHVQLAGYAGTGWQYLPS